MAILLLQRQLRNIRGSQTSKPKLQKCQDKHWLVSLGDRGRGAGNSNRESKEQGAMNGIRIQLKSCYTVLVLISIKTVIFKFGLQQLSTASCLLSRVVSPCHPSCYFQKNTFPPKRKWYSYLSNDVPIIKMLRMTRDTIIIITWLLLNWRGAKGSCDLNAYSVRSG